MYKRTIEHLNCGGQEHTTQSAVYDSYTPVILKQGQGHQTWFELVLNWIRESLKNLA